VTGNSTFSTVNNQVYAMLVQSGITETITGVTLTVGDNTARIKPV